MSVSDVLYLLPDVFLLVMFGTAPSSIVNFFLSTQGQISAVGTVVSSGYGFLCGAYMPISQFSEGIQKVILCLPGTYGTSLVRNHAVHGAYREMGNQGFPAEIAEAIRDAVDCNLYFFGHSVGIGGMYAIMGGTVALLVAVSVFLNVWKGKKAR